MATKTALITGASAGIGARFAQLLAREGYDLILLARDESRLTEVGQKLTEEFGVACEILVADLSTQEGSDRAVARLSDSSAPIDILINNAGFGIRDSFLVSQASAELALFDVLARTPMRLLHAILPIMTARNSGTIINVSSVAGWTAGGSYSAAKSYLTVLSESLHTELLETEVNVLALCPGFTHTEFHQRGKMRMDRLPGFMWLDADTVVAKAWKDAKAGRAISIPGMQYGALAAIARFGPRPFVRKIGVRIRKKQRSK